MENNFNELSNFYECAVQEENDSLEDRMLTRRYQFDVFPDMREIQAGRLDDLYALELSNFREKKEKTKPLWRRIVNTLFCCCK